MQIGVYSSGGNPGVLFSRYQVGNNKCSRNHVCFLCRLLQLHNVVLSSVADPDPRSGAFLPPGSGIPIRDDFFTDLGSRI
jgi:hypothetical protein